MITFSMAVVAQSAQIVWIDSSLFHDRSRGISRLVKVEEIIYSTHSETTFRRPQFADEIRDLELGVVSDPTPERVDRLKTLVAEFERVKKADLATRTRRETLYLKPVMDDIQTKLKEFGRSNGYAIILDKSTDDPTVLVIGSGTPDVTIEFISFYNESFSKELRK